MDITVNNTTRTIAANSTIAELLQQMQLDISRIAIEHNGNILSREQVAATVLHEGDKLEIVSFVGGG